MIKNSNKNFKINLTKTIKVFILILVTYKWID